MLGNFYGASGSAVIHRPDRLQAFGEVPLFLTTPFHPDPEKSCILFFALHHPSPGSAAR
jgi:hypothetical protein